MNQKERMLAELPYKAWLDGLIEERTAARRLVHQFNNLSPDAREEQEAVIRKLFGQVGEIVHIEAPFRCDYGSNISVGNNFYANFNCTILDVGKVVIGDNVMFAPNVSLYTAGHPIHPESRNSGYEYGIGITIGNNVWLGGNVIVNPGVTIGNNVVIGAGSVVTKDIPDNMIAVGSPCRVIREITEEDRKYYYKDREFDVTDYM
ncbi:sugar O-acetyltransferase [Paenibacillus sp. FSL K6-1096]|uniref:sugar O-acetyltransferase n=1 Tax=Paenibacillus sp. FSL K6-1096 TaxID=2921460 RepID=UPI0030EB51C7